MFRRNSPHKGTCVFVVHPVHFTCLGVTSSCVLTSPENLREKRRLNGIMVIGVLLVVRRL